MLVHNGYVGHGGAEIVVTSADGADRRLLTDDTLDDVYPDWSPDGRTIAFSRRGNSPGYVVCLVDTAGRAVEEVATGRHPRWSPDGQRLVVDDLAEDSKGRYMTVFVIDLKSGDRRQLVWR
jgi:Tol biopolymer transport system component